MNKLKKKGGSMGQDERIAELEDEITQANRRIKELTEERDDAYARIDAMIEHVNDANALIDDWIEAFDLEMDDKGQWCWRENELWQRLSDLSNDYNKILIDWNRFVPKYNAVVAPRVRNLGRPLAASPSQKADVLKRRKAGQTLQSIANDTGLGLQTIRTIIDKADGVDRATLARLKRIAPDKFAEAKERARKRMRDALPKRINQTLKHGKALIKEAKG